MTDTRYWDQRLWEVWSSSSDYCSPHEDRLDDWEDVSDFKLERGLLNGESVDQETHL